MLPTYYSEQIIDDYFSELWHNGGHESQRCQVAVARGAGGAAGPDREGGARGSEPGPGGADLPSGPRHDQPLVPRVRGAGSEGPQGSQAWPSSGLASGAVAG